MILFNLPRVENFGYSGILSLSMLKSKKLSKRTFPKSSSGIHYLLHVVHILLDGICVIISRMLGIKNALIIKRLL